MGCDHSSDRAELAAHYLDAFPVRERYVYLNHAAVAPVCRPAADAMHWLADDCLWNGSSHYDRWLASYSDFRKAAARLIGAGPAEIAMVKNTSEGIATIALGFPWKSGDRVVAFREEFPANYFPWLRLQQRGVEVVWLSIYDPLEMVEAACRDARLLAISFVNYLNGFRASIAEIGDICRRHNVFFFLDAIQGLGALPLDVRQSGVHALAADGHKWLLGPEGCGLLYIAQEWQDRIEPVEFGWTNVARYADYASRDMTLRPDAGRYECGTLNTIGCFGLQAAMEFLLEVGVKRIAPMVLHLADRIAAGVTEKGYELAAPRTPETASGIVSFRRPDVDSRMLVHRLKEAGIVAAPRQGWVRTSPHFYVGTDGVDRFLEVLP